MNEIIWLIAVTWLAISNVYLTYAIVKLKILDKAKDLYEFKKVIEKPKKEVEIQPLEEEIPFNRN